MEVVCAATTIPCLPQEYVQAAVSIYPTTFSIHNVLYAMVAATAATVEVMVAAFAVHCHMSILPISVYKLVQLVQLLSQLLYHADVILGVCHARLQIMPIVLFALMHLNSYRQGSV
jgi:uncharacterized membrane protein